MGIELEFGFLLVIQIIGTETFAPFEVETPPLRKIVKWSFIAALTFGFYQLVGHWSLLVPMIGVLVGGVFHFIWCSRNGIHPLRATPRRRYYELRGWHWPEK